MAKTKKPKKQKKMAKKTKFKGKSARGVSASQTHQPFEQDVKRRIGHFGGAGEPPIMK